MLRKYARLLLPEIRITFNGTRAEAFINRKPVFFDFSWNGSDPHEAGEIFLLELRRLKQTYLRYSLIKPKLVIKLGGASGDKILLKEALEKAVHGFDHLLAVIVDGSKKMIV